MWMDEGDTYFLPLDLQIELSEYDHRTRAATGFSKWAGNEMDIPLYTPISSFTRSSFKYDELLQNLRLLSKMLGLLWGMNAYLKRMF
ncbi:MAG: hypothetical protein IPI19_16570 [Ignavibacteriales bacterium]|nr:hypothetical protein [Ignavibacteriales bacterium]